VDTPIFVINLERSPDRLAHAAAELARQDLPFHRVPAVDGSLLSDAEIASVHDATRTAATYHVPMQRGEIACFLSHRHAWQSFLEETSAPFAVVLEDDFELRGTLRPVIRALASQSPPRWDMIKLWAKEKRLVREVSALAAPYRLVRELVISKRTVGQIVSREGATKLLARTLPIHLPIDVQLQYPWELGIEVLALRPSLVIDVGDQRFGGSSTKDPVALGYSKLGREARRVVLQADLTARSLARFVRPLRGNIGSRSRGKSRSFG
jgi:glycosyl transferase family 25